MEDSIRSEYFELLKFESVGADPAHFKDCLNCASWLRRWLGKLGFDVELAYPKVATEGVLPPPPVVFAVRKGVEGVPPVLVYGHYDVQPADPLSEWKTPPFEPTVEGDRVYCRGAQDDKGQFFAFLCGLRDLVSGPDAAKLPTLKVLVDGQEESESRALTALLADREFAHRLAAGALLVCDTSAAEGLRPSIVAGLRGMCGFTLRVRGASRDLHSGEYGGVAPNAAAAAAALVASLHAPDGSVAVEGFLDGIEPPTDEERRLAEASMPGEGAYRKDIGCDPSGGQRGKTAAERVAFEPTVELNGFHSGYGGKGGKTVIPAEAIVKITMRLVPGQSPRRAMECVRRHLSERCPQGITLSFEDFAGGAGGFRLPLASPIFRLAEHLLSEMDPRGPLFQWDGASIPVVSAIRDASGAAPLIVGWGQSEDRIHSPNESYSFAQFDKARDWARRILGALSW